MANRQQAMGSKQQAAGEGQWQVMVVAAATICIYNQIQ